jgi:predicted nucleic acid-binding protein
MNSPDIEPRSSVPPDSKEANDLLLTLLLTSVAVVPYERIAPYLSDADVLIGAIDPDDVPFVALALAEEHDGIWSNDRAFEDLPGIQHWTTTSLKTHLRL